MYDLTVISEVNKNDKDTGHVTKKKKLTSKKICGLF